MRIAIGCFAQESHSFSPVPGSWIHFGPQNVARGHEMLAGDSGARTELAGALHVAREAGVELVPLLCARASSSAGPLLREVFEQLLGELLDRLGEAKPVDGVFLVLHGAMLAEGYDDATGEVLRAVRSEVGPAMPVVGTLDLHANVTARMVEQATVLVGYRTAPHVDMFETGQRGMAMLLKTIRGEVRPVSALRRLPMLLPGETARTDAGPLAEVVSEAGRMATLPGMLEISLFSAQPWLDVPDVGCSVLVTTDGDQRLAGQTADHLADVWWARRTQFAVELTPTQEAIRRALASDRYPFVLADSADAPSSGAPGDSTVVLQALLAADPQKDCLLNIVDPDAVAGMIAAGVGRYVKLRLGAKFAPAFYDPVEVTGYVKLLSDGEFRQKGPGFQGITCHMGRTGVLRIGHIHLVVMERACRQWDPELYRSVGLEPRDAQIVVVKSPAAFRAAYAPFAAEIMILDAPGVCSPNLRALPFRRVRRPLFPLDEPADWRVTLTAD